MSRLIEECFEAESIEEDYGVWATTVFGTTMIIVDPYAINMDDIRNMEPGKISIIRARRPIWGRGHIGDYIHKIELGERK